MQRQAISPGELQQAKALLLREIPLAESSIDDIAQGLIYRATHELPIDEPTRAARQYLRLTADEVQKAFARWLRPNDLVQITQGPAPQ
jgi:zinc protease